MRNHASTQLTTQLTRIVAAGLLAAALPGTTAAQAAPRLDQVMSAEERRATGVDRLSLDERVALEAWLARYAAVVSSASAAHPAPASADAPPAPGDFARPAASGPCASAPTRVGVLRSLRAGALVCDNVEGGSFLTLEDGTMWEVYLPDRTQAATWAPGAFVILRENPAPVGATTGLFEYVLDAGGGSRARARYAGRVQPGAVGRMDSAAAGPTIFRRPAPKPAAPPRRTRTSQTAAGEVEPSPASVARRP